MQKPHLSVVATSRNDNHGGNSLYRTYHFVKGLIEQSNRHKVATELLLVDWNPPQDRAPLSKALELPEKSEYCQVRFITVPPEVHAEIEHGDKLPLFQMIGKNVGIRRAQGDFVLATNIDILFSDALMEYMRDELRPHISYRVDRMDVPDVLPDTSSFDELLEFCRRHIVCANTTFGSIFPQAVPHELPRLNRMLQKVGSKNPFVFARKLFFHTGKKIFYALARHSIFRTQSQSLYKKVLLPFSKFLIPIYTNASGDFALFSKKDWEALRGYPEWPLYSWNLDGLLLFQAEQLGLREITVPHPIYHISHGNGFLAAHPDELFDRLKTQGIPYIDHIRLKELANDLKKPNATLLYNDENWGMFDKELVEEQKYG